MYYVLWVTCLSAVIATALGVLIYQQSTFASREIIAGLNAAEMEWLNPQAKESIRQALGRSDMGLAATMLGIGIALALVLMASLIVVTHRVAGPLLRAVRYFDQLAAGRLPTVGPLRKGDQLTEFFATLGSTLEALRNRATQDIEIVQAFLDACVRHEGLGTAEVAKALDALRLVQQQKGDALKS